MTHEELEKEVTALRDRVLRLEQEAYRHAAWPPLSAADYAPSYPWRCYPAQATSSVRE